jgi:hypothetical protein
MGRLGTTRNTRGFIFAVASMAQFRGFRGGKKRWKTYLMLDKLRRCHPPFPERGDGAAAIQIEMSLMSIRPKIRALCAGTRQLPAMPISDYA